MRKVLFYTILIIDIVLVAFIIATEMGYDINL